GLPGAIRLSLQRRQAAAHPVPQPELQLLQPGSDLRLPFGDAPGLGRWVGGAADRLLGTGALRLLSALLGASGPGSEPFGHPVRRLVLREEGGLALQQEE